MENEMELLAESFEQLEALKEELQHQKSASERLTAVVESIARLAEQIGSLPAALRPLVDRAARTQEQAQHVVGKIGALADSIPEIVRRLEQSDYGQSLGRVAEAVSSAERAVFDISSSVADIQQAAKAVSADTERAVERVGADLQAVESSVSKLSSSLDQRFGLLEQSVGSQRDALMSTLNQIGAAWSQVASEVAANAARQTHLLEQIQVLRTSDFASLRDEVGALQIKLDHQSKLLETMSKKKGIFLS